MPAAPSAPRTPRDKVAAFINHPVTDHVVAALIVLSVVLLALELLTGSVVLHHVGQAIMAVFAVELLLRFVAARSARQFFRTYWLDILSILPLFRSWRVLRFVRLIRLLRLGPLLMRSNRRLTMTIRQSLGEQAHLLAIIGVTILGVALAMLEVEAGNPDFQGLDDTLWWAVFSMIAAEPVGGTAQTPLGRLFTLVLVTAGLTVFAVFTGTVSAVMAERFRNGARGAQMRLDDLNGHIVICGWNRSGHIVIEELQHSAEWRDRAVVVVAEKRPHDWEHFAADPNVILVESDCTRADVLKEAGVERAARAILLADKSVPERSDQDRDARTLLSALTIEKLSPGIFCCAELLSRANEPHLIMAGIEEVVIADEYSGALLATSSRVRGVTQIADELFSAKYGNQIYKRPARPEWVGRRFIELQQLLKAEFDATLIGIGKGAAAGEPAQHEGIRCVRTLTNPPAGEPLAEGDLLVFFARGEPKW